MWTDCCRGLIFDWKRSLTAANSTFRQIWRVWPIIIIIIIGNKIENLPPPPLQYIMIENGSFLSPSPKAPKTKPLLFLGGVWYRHCTTVQLRFWQMAKWVGMKIDGSLVWKFSSPVSWSSAYVLLLAGASPSDTTFSAPEMKLLHWSLRLNDNFVHHDQQMAIQCVDFQHKNLHAWIV